MKPWFLIRQHGFSLAGTILGTLVVGAVTAGGALLYADYKQDQVAQGRGRQLGTGLEQLDRFARKYQTQLTGGTSITGVANAYAPTTAEMQALGFAASGFSDVSQPGGAIVFQIVREPGCTAAKCILVLKAVTSGSVKINGATDAEFAQRIAGYVPNGAGWSNLATDATKLSKNGRTISNPLGSVPAVIAAMAWLGSSQASQTVPPPSTTYQNIPCASGYSGSGTDQHQTVTTDKWGATTTTGWVTDSYDCTANVCSNGATNYPTCTFPVTSGSTGDGSTGGGSTGGGTGSTGGGTDPGYCTNGATDYPICTPKEVSCANGASDPPTCTPPVCPNGAPDYPTCTISPPPQCPEPYLYCRMLRGYPDGTNQLSWGSVTFSPAPACTKIVKVAGAGRVIDCPEPYGGGALQP